MKYENLPVYTWCASVLSRVFSMTIDDVIDQWTTSGVIDVGGKGLDANLIFTAGSYRETAERYTFLKYDPIPGLRGYPSLYIDRGVVLSVEDFNGITNRIYVVLLDKETSAVILPCWIEVDIYTRQTIIYTKK